MITSEKIANFVNGKLYGNADIHIKGAFDLVPGKKSFISFLNNDSKLNLLENTKSDLIVVSNKIEFNNINKTIIAVSNPNNSFFDIVKNFFDLELNNVKNGIEKTAFISDSSNIGSNVSIGHNVTIEENVIIQDNVSIGANTYIGENSFIGLNSKIHPNVTIYNDVAIGSNVIIHSSSVLGADGFGILANKDKLIKVPHIGRVEVQDDVVIGAGCTVDRATMNKTVIGKGTKIDGQVHIAHNVQIGKNCIIAGQAAIGGSSKIGDNVIFGGQVGVIDNLIIGNNCKIGAKSAVMKSLDDNMVVSGIPAIDHRKKRRLDVLVSKLPELFKKK